MSDKIVRELLDALESAERAIITAITHQDGLDGTEGSEVAKRISGLLVKYYRPSRWDQMSEKEVS